MAEIRLCAHLAHFMFFVGTQLSYISQPPLLLVESCDWVLAKGMRDTCRPSPKTPTLSSVICHLDDDASLETTMLRATSRQKPWKWKSHSLEGAWISKDCREQPSPLYLYWSYYIVTWVKNILLLWYATEIRGCFLQPLVYLPWIL